MTTHDDLPHPVPAFAHMRYKENYFFILMAPNDGIFGVFHFNHEPGFDRVKYTANVSVRGRTFLYSNLRTPFPDNWVRSREIGDGKLSLKFIVPHDCFELELRNEEIHWKCNFSARHQTFDYHACKAARGDGFVSVQEVLTCGTNLQYEHQQQALNAAGTIAIADTGEEIAFNGVGYRDHSWCMRADHLVSRHSWSAIIFPDFVIGARMMESGFRPGASAAEGYIADKNGTRALMTLETREEGELSQDGLPARLIHEVTDVFGEKFVVASDIKGRLAHVPLSSETPDRRPGYQIVENFCRSNMNGADNVCSLIEFGRSFSNGGSYL
ncbi:hypothetical protein ACWGM0_06760 [Sphingomonas bisphenolicum]